MKSIVWGKGSTECRYIAWGPRPCAAVCSWSSCPGCPQCGAAEVSCSAWTHRGVFPQLAQRWEGLLVGLADLVDQLLQLSAQLVVLGQHHLLLHLLLLLVSVVAYGCIQTPVATFSPTLFCFYCFWSCARSSVAFVPSLDMPTSKHFCSRQYWQRLRVTLLIWQFLSRWQVYTMFFWMLRRKKPWRWQMENSSFTASTASGSLSTESFFSSAGGRSVLLSGGL